MEQSRTQDVYDGFISYSHSADDLLAPRLQAGLQRFAKPWWKRRAVRIFRDESSLAANPHLWLSITEALEDSSWFVLLLSEDAASSEWVGKEIEHWIANKPADRILPVVTDGEFMWVGDVAGSSVPPALHGVFQEEPRWVDLRFAKGDENLDLKNPEFSSAVADIAATIRGIPKDELASEEVRQHRRTVRIAWAAGIAVTALAVVSIVAGVFAVGQRNDARDNAALAQANAAAEAEARMDADANATLAEENAVAEAEARQLADSNAALAEARELAASAINVLDRDPELSILLTLAAIDATPSGQEQPAETIDALWRAVQKDRLESVVDTGYGDGTFVALSPDDSILFVVNGVPVGGWPQDLVVQAYSTSDLTLLWEHEGVVGDIFDSATDGDYLFLYLFVSPDGTRLAMGVAGPIGRLVVFDASSGAILQTVFSECGGAMATWGWSPDGSYLVVDGGCDSLDVLDGETFERVAAIDLANYSEASFDDRSRLFVFSSFGNVAVYEPPAYTEPTFLDGVRGVGDVSPDGSTVVTFFAPPDPCFVFRGPLSLPDCGTVAAYDTRTGDLVDVLKPLPAIPSDDGLSFGFSGSDRLYAVPTSGAETLVWDIGSGEQVFRLPSGVAVNAATTTDGKRLYSGHQNGQFKVWDLSPNVGLDPMGDVATYTLISANSNVVSQTLGAFVGTDPGTFESQVFFFDLDTGSLVGTPVAGQLPITAIAGDRFLITEPYASGSRTPSAWFVYDPVSGEGERLAGCDINPATSLCLDGSFPIPYFWGAKEDGSLVVRFGDGSLTLVDPEDGSVAGQLNPSAPFEFVGIFTEEMIGGSSQGQVLFESLITGEELARIPDGGNRFDGDSGTSVFYRVESVGAVDMTTWDVWFFPIELGRVQGMAVDSVLRRLALGDENGIQVYDLDTGQKLNSIPVQGIADLHWIDEDHVLVGTQTGAWAAVSLITEDLIASARAGVTRGFTDAECETYRIDPCPTLEEIRGR